MTNGDRLRNMTDEEIARFLSLDKADQDFCAIHRSCLNFDCSECALEWLKQEDDVHA